MWPRKSARRVPTMKRAWHAPANFVQASYAALNLALLTHYALSRDLYHTGLALGTLALFP